MFDLQMFDVSPVVLQIHLGLIEKGLVLNLMLSFAPLFLMVSLVFKSRLPSFMCVCVTMCRVVEW